VVFLKNFIYILNKFDTRCLITIPVSVNHNSKCDHVKERQLSGNPRIDNDCGASLLLFLLGALKPISPLYFALNNSKAKQSRGAAIIYIICIYITHAAGPQKYVKTTKNACENVWRKIGEHLKRGKNFELATHTAYKIHRWHKQRPLHSICSYLSAY